MQHRRTAKKAAATMTLPAIADDASTHGKRANAIACFSPSPAALHMPTMLLPGCRNDGHGCSGRVLIRDRLDELAHLGLALRVGWPLRGHLLQVLHLAVLAARCRAVGPIRGLLRDSRPTGDRTPLLLASHRFRKYLPERCSEAKPGKPLSMELSPAIPPRRQEGRGSRARRDLLRKYIRWL